MVLGITPSTKFVYSLRAVAYVTALFLCCHMAGLVKYPEEAVHSHEGSALFLKGTVLKKT